MIWLLWLALALGGAPELDAEIARGAEAWAQGDDANALVHWSVALVHARDAGDAAAELDLLLRLSAVNRRIGRLDAADRLLDTASERATSPLDGARVSLGRGLLALSGGDARSAEALFQAAFSAHRDAGDPRGAATAALDLGLARQALGRPDDARKAFAAAASLFEALGDPSGRADALTNLGVADRRAGRLGDARGALEQAVALFRATGDVGGEADALGNLGAVLQDLGLDELAEALYRTALAAARDRRDVDRQARLLVNLGTLLHAAGDLHSADAHYATAEQAFEELGRDADAASVGLARALLGDDAAALEQVRRRAVRAGDRRLEAVAALNLASLTETSSPAGAARLLARASELADALELSDVRWRAAYLSGRLTLRQGRASDGIAHLRAAVDELERTRVALAAGESRSFLTDQGEVYQALIDALMRAGDNLGALAYAQRLQLSSLPPPPVGDHDLAQRYHALAHEEQQVAAALSVELARAPTGADAQRAQALRDELDELRVVFSQTIDELRSGYDGFDQLVRVDPEDIEAIQRDLEPGVVVLQPVLLEDRLVLLLFRRERLQAFTVEVPEAEVTSTIARLARVLQAGLIQDPTPTTHLADKLGGWLLAPILHELQDAEVLVVSASGPFRQLPFALLRHDGRYLVEDVAVVGVTHVGSLRQRAATDLRFRVEGKGLLLVGNPDGTLPAAEDEVEAIAQRFPGATILTGSSGTRDAVFAGASGKTSIHLATHGRIDPDRPDRSHLVLSGDDGTGRLSYREIPGLAPHLRDSRLVVLSACESGLPVHAREHAERGEVIVSIEGLAAQFRRAGVETLVASLWKVDDEGTRQLMDLFYKELAAGRDIGRAMQAAQVQMLAQERWTHPWYWAAFVVMGDWR